MWPNPQESADLVTFTEETLNGKLHFLCSDYLSPFSVYLECEDKYNLSSGKV